MLRPAVYRLPITLALDNSVKRSNLPPSTLARKVSLMSPLDPAAVSKTCSWCNMTFSYQEGKRRLTAKVTENKRSFWDRLFGTNNRSGRQDKVLEYVIHRIQDGANLREVLQEEYVRRNATTEEVQRILENPRLIEAAGEQLREDFSSGKLDPRQRDVR
jgi:hypothetical protein